MAVYIDEDLFYTMKSCEMNFATLQISVFMRLLVAPKKVEVFVCTKMLGALKQAEQR